jgi:hypothetical protein
VRTETFSNFFCENRIWWVSKNEIPTQHWYLAPHQSKARPNYFGRRFGGGKSPSRVNDRWGAHSILKDCVEQDNYVSPRKTWGAGVPPPWLDRSGVLDLFSAVGQPTILHGLLISPAKYQHIIISLPPFLERGRPSFLGSPWLFLFLWTMNCLSLLSKEKEI